MPSTEFERQVTGTEYNFTRMRNTATAELVVTGAGVIGSSIGYAAAVTRDQAGELHPAMGFTDVDGTVCGGPGFEVKA